MTQDYPLAVAAGRRSLEERPSAPLVHRWLAAALGQLGRREEAQEVMHRAAKVLAPVSFDAYASQRGPWLQETYHAHLIEGLRLAGWGDGK